MPPVAEADAVGEYLTVGQAAEFLGVSPWTLRKWDRAGKLKARRHPKSHYRIYRHCDLQAILRADGVHRVSSRSLPPRTDWSEMGPTEHFVQFYESDEFLAESVAGFVAAGLAKGEGAVVIGTPLHRERISRRLQSLGCDPSGPAAEGRYMALDAAETLSRFMVDGSPDPRRFADVIGPVIGQLACGGRDVRAFGEMVALLWSEGRQASAVRLEELWNELARRHRFALFCAYPIQEFGRESDGARFADVCACHSRVIPAESYAGLPAPDERLRAIARLQQKAQALEAEIAQRKEAEKALRQRERELSDFLESSLEGLHRVGPDGTILWANRAELDLLGYEREEYIGRPIAEFHADADAIDDMLGKLTRGEALYDFPARLRCKDGSIKQVLVHSTGYFEAGRFVYSRCFTRDVTAIKEAEARQQQALDRERSARADAERVSRMKDEFLATLSHELRTPLNAIYGWTQIIKESVGESDTVSEGISVIDRNVRAQKQLIEDLLDMSRIISGKIRLQTKQTELAPVLEAALASIRPAADAKAIRIRTVLDTLAGPVMADGERLQQVIWNLLSNAVKFTPAGGKIDVSLERVNSHLQITVSDSGEGISPEFMPHIFERFRQADSSATRQHGGLGIGLSIAKQLVELHGGTLTARSDGKGLGSSFTVSLPPHTKGPAPTAPAFTGGGNPASDCPAVRLHGIRVLVVDNEADSRELIGRVLKRHDAQVMTASSADEALGLVEADRPHVIVSDIGMPGKDGYQLLRELRSRRLSDRIPAIALTAFARSEDRMRALLAGYQVHLPKPVEPHELLAAVAGLVGET